MSPSCLHGGPLSLRGCGRTAGFLLPFHDTRWSAGSGHPPKHLPSQLLSVPPSLSQSSLCFLLFHLSSHQSLSVIYRGLYFHAGVHLKVLFFHLSFCFLLHYKLNEYLEIKLILVILHTKNACLTHIQLFIS